MIIELKNQFLEVYLNNIGRFASIDEYKSDSKWTNKIMAIAQWSIYEMLLKQLKNKAFDPEIYDAFIDSMYKIDALGYFTPWWKCWQKEKQQVFNWIPLIAYEHENADLWDDELCKLCHICADLKIISSYYSNEDIATVLHNKVDMLGNDMLYRYGKSNWLFIFGPRKQVGYHNEFRVFTINNELDIEQIRPKVQLVPSNFGNGNPLESPNFLKGPLPNSFSFPVGWQCLT